MAHPALVVIDIQNDYFAGGNMPLHEPQAAAERAAEVLDRFRQRSWPCFHPQHASLQPGATFMIPDTPGQEIAAILTPAENETVITKHFPSAFQNTTLHEQLQSLAIDQLVICGMMTHMCIDTSVRAAFERGYRIQLIGDATATRSLQYGGNTLSAESVQTAYLAGLSGVFATVLNTQEWLGQS